VWRGTEEEARVWGGDVEGDRECKRGSELQAISVFLVCSYHELRRPMSHALDEMR
jgi:hypothetical protein